MDEYGEKIQIYDKYVWGTFILQTQNTLKVKQANSFNLPKYYTMPQNGVNVIGYLLHLKDLFVNRKLEFSITLPEIKTNLALFGFQF